MVGSLAGGDSRHSRTAVGDSRLSLERRVCRSVGGPPDIRRALVSVGRIPPRDDIDLSMVALDGAGSTSRGPARLHAPNKLWLVGLGHLGQAFVWSLLTLPYREARGWCCRTISVSARRIEATSLLVLAQPKIGERKVRLASAWLEHGGWETALIERRHRGDLRPTADDPPFLLSGLDDLAPRKLLAGAGFDYMVDAGIGHGPGDFEGIQVRIIPNSGSVEGLWNASENGTSKDRLLAGEAYQSLERENRRVRHFHYGQR